MTGFDVRCPAFGHHLTQEGGIAYDVAMSSATDAEAFGGYIADRMTFMDPEKTAEEALLTATQTPTQPSARGPGSHSPRHDNRADDLR